MANNRGIPRGKPLNPRLQGRLRAALQTSTEQEMSDRMSISRLTIARALAGLCVHEATAVLIETRLADMERRTP